MAEPIVHSVAEPPKHLEVTKPNKSIDPRVAELLQSIYAASRTAATSMGLSKAVDSAQDAQSFVDPDEVREFSLDAGYDAVNRIWNEAEEIARLLGIELQRPSGYQLKPVFDGK